MPVVPMPSNIVYSQPLSSVFPTFVGAILHIYIYIYINIFHAPRTDGPPALWMDDPAARSPPSAWLESLLERLPSKSSEHTKQVCQSHQARLSSKSSEQVSHPSPCLEDLLGRLARETCLGDLIGRLARPTWEPCLEDFLGLWPNERLSEFLVKDCFANCDFIWAVLSMSIISCSVYIYT